MKKRLKLNGVIMAIATFLIAFFPTIFLRGTTLGSLDEITEILGIAFILLGQLFRVSARGFKSENSLQGNALIKEGPYSLVRNPMYLGILLIGLGVVLILFKWWVAFIFLSIFTIRYILLIFSEEKKLAGIFLQEYKDYQKNVPRLLPSFKMLFLEDISAYLPLRPSWIKKEIGSISVILFFTLLLESWEDIRKEGISGYFKEAAALFIIIIFFALLSVYLSKRTSSLKNGLSNRSKNNKQ